MKRWMLLALLGGLVFTVTYIALSMTAWHDSFESVCHQEGGEMITSKFGTELFCVSGQSVLLKDTGGQK